MDAGTLPRRRSIMPHTGRCLSGTRSTSFPPLASSTYQTHYEVAGTGIRYSAAASIAFPELEEVTELVGAAGLRIESLLGDWEGSPWHANAREIVFVGGLA